METWLPVIGGLVLLIAGGELLVRGAVQVASRLGVSPLVIGITLVGFGTSIPELVTSVQAALRGSPGIAYGNIVGSNIANILLILGAATVLTPIMVASSTLRREGFLMILVAVVFAVVALTTTMSSLIGAVFVAALAAYIFIALRQERVPTADHGAIYDKSCAAQEVDSALVPADPSGRSVAASLATAVAGLGLIVLGGYLLVNGAVNLARAFSVSETVIGLTIVAVGTSMPELVTSIMAAIRKESDVAFGNVIGSNIYNILGIGGVTALMAPAEIPDDIVRSDNMVMVGVSILIVVLAYTGRRISRAEGALLLAGYVAYIVWLFP